MHRQAASQPLPCSMLLCLPSCLLSPRASRACCRRCTCHRAVAPCATTFLQRARRLPYTTCLPALTASRRPYTYLPFLLVHWQHVAWQQQEEGRRWWAGGTRHGAASSGCDVAVRTAYGCGVAHARMPRARAARQRT